jgi:hypothetical protein
MEIKRAKKLLMPTLSISTWKRFSALKLTVIENTGGQPLII